MPHYESLNNAQTTSLLMLSQCFKQHLLAGG